MTHGRWPAARTPPAGQRAGAVAARRVRVDHDRGDPNAATPDDFAASKAARHARALRRRARAAEEERRRGRVGSRDARIARALRCGRRRRARRRASSSCPQRGTRRTSRLLAGGAPARGFAAKTAAKPWPWRERIGQIAVRESCRGIPAPRERRRLRRKRHDAPRRDKAARPTVSAAKKLRLANFTSRPLATRALRGPARALPSPSPDGSRRLVAVLTVKLASRAQLTPTPQRGDDAEPGASSGVCLRFTGACRADGVDARMAATPSSLLAP